MQNIVAGFRTTGVYPCDRTVLRQVKPPSFDPAKLGEKMGLKFIPLYSPFHPPRQQTHRSPRFTDEEMVRFQQRFEEGYDLVHDEAYNQWVQLYHPSHQSSPISPPDRASVAAHLHFEQSFDDPLEDESTSALSTTTESYQRHTSPSSDKSSILSHSSVLSKFLTNAAPEICMPAARPKTSARVLTSLENIKIMEEKERQKKEAAEEKRAAAERRKQAAEKKKEELVQKGAAAQKRREDVAKRREEAMKKSAAQKEKEEARAAAQRRKEEARAEAQMKKEEARAACSPEEERCESCCSEKKGKRKEKEVPSW